MIIILRNISIITICSVIIILPCQRVFSGDHQVKQKTSTARQSLFDPFGLYYIVEGKEDAFDDYFTIQIDLLEKPKKGKPLEMAGHVQFGKKESFLFADLRNLKLSLTDPGLSFETEEVEGISFRFAGRFLRMDTFSKLRRGTPVLEGILIKKVRGKEVANEKLKFAFSDPG